MKKQELNLYFDSLNVKVYSKDENLLQNIKRDFMFFLEKEKDATKIIEIEAKFETPDYSIIKGPFIFHHFDGADCYGLGDLRFAKYDKSLLIFDSTKNKGEVISSDPVLLHQYTYYMIISKSGEYYDLNNIHRIHSLGFSYNDTACAIMMNRAGGKTTLALELIKDDKIKIFSEDTPLITPNLSLKAFPVRFALRLDNKTEIPAEYTRTIKEPFFGDKRLVDISFWGFEKFEKEKPLSHIFIAKRCEIETPKIEKMNKFIFFINLLDCYVKGKQFPQRAELLFRISPRGLITLTKMAFLRFFSAVKIAFKIKAYTFTMTNNREQNAEFLKNFILQNSSNN